MRHLKKALFLLLAAPQFAWAQINTDRVMLMGRNALYYEDYVLSMQYFNMVINAKPYLAEPYFFRGLAKFYLEDFMGAVDDCHTSVEINPFVPKYYELLGVSYINLKEYDKAIEAYGHLLKVETENKNAWHNYVLCLLETKKLELADEKLDVAIKKWPSESRFYTVKAQVAFEKKDTLAGVAILEKALEVNEYDELTWEMLSVVRLQQENFAAAEEALTKVIELNKANAGYYINRALARYKQSNLRGAMADYDEALVVDPKNYLGHFNRGLLRSQVGDDNRAIEDFDFVLEVEPDNVIARFNRALMRKNTGDYQGALEDISLIIKEYPSFWNGYEFRSEVRRLLGDAAGAEKDAFVVMKARMESRFQNKRNTASNGTRKRSSSNLDDYDKLVEADTLVYRQEYESAYRGKVQNAPVETTPEAPFVLTFYPQRKSMERSVAYHPLLEQWSRDGIISRKIYLANQEETLDEQEVSRHFNELAQMADSSLMNTAAVLSAHLLLNRSIQYYIVQNYDEAMNDVNAYLRLIPQDNLAYFLRAQIKIKQLASLSVAEKKGGAASLSIGYAAALSDLEKVTRQVPDFKYAYYNIGYIYLVQNDYKQAATYFSKALELDAFFAEAWYNRGLCLWHTGDYDAAVKDMSQAGELGIYTSYSLIKKMSKQQKNGRTDK